MNKGYIQPLLFILVGIGVIAAGAFVVFEQKATPGAETAPISSDTAPEPTDTLETTPVPSPTKNPASSPTPPEIMLPYETYFYTPLPHTFEMLVSARASTPDTITSQLTKLTTDLPENTVADIILRGISVSGSPLSFDAFAQIFYPHLNEAQRGAFTEKVTFFAYKDADGVWPGFIASTQDEDELALQALQTLEALSAEELTSLYVSDPGAPVAGGFQDGIIDQIPSRYQKFAQQGAALNYFLAPDGTALVSTSYAGMQAAVAAMKAPPPTPTSAPTAAPTAPPASPTGNPPSSGLETREGVIATRLGLAPLGKGSLRPAFSKDREHFAYSRRNSSGTYIIWDSEYIMTLGRTSGPVERLQYNSDGSEFLAKFTIADENYEPVRTALVINDQDIWNSEAYEGSIQPYAYGFTPDDRYYVGIKYETSSSFYIDGKKVYTAETGEGTTKRIYNWETEEYEKEYTPPSRISFEWPVFSKDGSNWALIKEIDCWGECKDTNTSVVVNGKEYGPYSGIEWGSLQFSNSGDDIAYVAGFVEDNTTYNALFLNGEQIGDRYPQRYSVPTPYTTMFSPDDMRITYKIEDNTNDDGGVFLRHFMYDRSDGSISEFPNYLNYENPRFSADGNQFAYSGYRRFEQDAKTILVLDGEETGDWYSFILDIRFSSDGEHVAALVAPDSGVVGHHYVPASYAVVLDNEITKVYPYVTNLGFSEDGQYLEYNAIQYNEEEEREVYHIKIPIR